MSKATLAKLQTPHGTSHATLVKTNPRAYLSGDQSIYMASRSASSRTVARRLGNSGLHGRHGEDGRPGKQGAMGSHPAGKGGPATNGTHGTAGSRGASGPHMVVTISGKFGRGDRVPSSLDVAISHERQLPAIGHPMPSPVEHQHVDFGRNQESVVVIDSTGGCGGWGGHGAPGGQGGSGGRGKAGKAGKDGEVHWDGGDGKDGKAGGEGGIGGPGGAGGNAAAGAGRSIGA